jgi:hypothetical protein
MSVLEPAADTALGRSALEPRDAYLFSIAISLKRLADQAEIGPFSEERRVGDMVIRYTAPTEEALCNLVAAAEGEMFKGTGNDD